jgi:hypothetical protein
MHEKWVEEYGRTLQYNWIFGVCPFPDFECVYTHTCTYIAQALIHNGHESPNPYTHEPLRVPEARHGTL